MNGVTRVRCLACLLPGLLTCASEGGQQADLRPGDPGSGDDAADSVAADTGGDPGRDVSPDPGIDVPPATCASDCGTMASR